MIYNYILIASLFDHLWLDWDRLEVTGQGCVYYFYFTVKENIFVGYLIEFGFKGGTWE